MNYFNCNVSNSDKFIIKYKDKYLAHFSLTFSMFDVSDNCCNAIIFKNYLAACLFVSFLETNFPNTLNKWFVVHCGGRYVSCSRV